MAGRGSNAADGADAFSAIRRARDSYDDSPKRPAQSLIFVNETEQRLVIFNKSGNEMHDM